MFFSSKPKTRSVSMEPELTQRTTRKYGPIRVNRSLRKLEATQLATKAHVQGALRVGIEAAEKALEVGHIGNVALTELDIWQLTQSIRNARAGLAAMEDSRIIYNVGVNQFLFSSHAREVFESFGVRNINAFLFCDLASIEESHVRIPYMLKAMHSPQHLKC